MIKIRPPTEECETCRLNPREDTAYRIFRVNPLVHLQRLI